MRILIHIVITLVIAFVTYPFVDDRNAYLIGLVAGIVYCRSTDVIGGKQIWKRR
jgi:hypothetical protein